MHIRRSLGDRNGGAITPRVSKKFHAAGAFFAGQDGASGAAWGANHPHPCGARPGGQVGEYGHAGGIRDSGLGGGCEHHARVVPRLCPLRDRGFGIDQFGDFLGLGVGEAHHGVAAACYPGERLRGRRQLRHLVVVLQVQCNIRRRDRRLGR